MYIDALENLCPSKSNNKMLNSKKRQFLQSTKVYYTFIKREVQQFLWLRKSARLLVHSVYSRSSTRMDGVCGRKRGREKRRLPYLDHLRIEIALLTQT